MLSGKCHSKLWDGTIRETEEPIMNFRQLRLQCQRVVHGSVFAAVLAGLGLVLLTADRAEAQKCPRGFEAQNYTKEGTLKYYGGGPVKISRTGRYYTEVKLPELRNGEKLSIKVISKKFRPLLRLFNKDTGEFLKQSRPYKGAAVISSFAVKKDGNYVVVVSTLARKKQGRWRMRYRICAVKKEERRVLKKGTPCDPNRSSQDRTYLKVIKNYKNPITSFDDPRKQAFCYAGGCSGPITTYKRYEGLPPISTPWGYWTFTTEGGGVRNLFEMYDHPRLGPQYCPTRPK